jgi:hypothetical protein
MLKLRKDVKLEIDRKAQIELKKTLFALKEATPVDTGEARDGWHLNKNTIENDVPHINFLNEGTSKQAPAHFIEQTILDNPNLVVRGMIVRDR